MHGKFSRHCNRIRLVQSSNKPSNRYVDMKVKIKFLNRWCQVIYVDKTFVDKNHFNNYLNFMFTEYSYSVDEVWNNN